VATGVRVHRPQRSARGFALVALASALLGLATPAHTSTLVYASYGDIKDWDPAVAFSLESILLLNVYEPLIWCDPAGGGTTFRPGLATSWSQGPDKLTWTFKLRAGVVFHDGSAFDAAAAKASIERTMKLKQGASYIWDAVDRIEAPDATTLVIRTKQPAPIDLIAAAQYGAYIDADPAHPLGRCRHHLARPRRSRQKPAGGREGRPRALLVQFADPHQHQAPGDRRAAVPEGPAARLGLRRRRPLHLRLPWLNQAVRGRRRSWRGWPGRAAARWRDLGRVRRSRERGLLGLGQPLKSFRDCGIDFPPYAHRQTTSMALRQLGPLQKPEAPRRPEVGE